MTVDPAAFATIAASLGLGGILLELTKRLLGKITNRGGNRRDEVDRAWQRADREAAKRRIAEEHASQLRRQLLAAECVNPDDIPPWPTYTPTDTTPKDKS